MLSFAPVRRSSRHVEVGCAQQGVDLSHPQNWRGKLYFFAVLSEMYVRKPKIKHVWYKLGLSRAEGFSQSTASKILPSDSGTRGARDLSFCERNYVTVTSTDFYVDRFRRWFRLRLFVQNIPGVHTHMGGVRCFPRGVVKYKYKKRLCEVINCCDLNKRAQLPILLILRDLKRYGRWYGRLVIKSKLGSIFRDTRREEFGDKLNLFLLWYSKHALAMFTGAAFSFPRGKPNQWKKTTKIRSDAGNNYNFDEFRFRHRTCLKRLASVITTEGVELDAFEDMHLAGCVKQMRKRLRIPFLTVTRELRAFIPRDVAKIVTGYISIGEVGRIFVEKQMKKTDIGNYFKTIDKKKKKKRTHPTSSSSTPMKQLKISF